MMKAVLITFFWMLAWAIIPTMCVSCSMLAQKGNCFGPPDASLMQSHAQFTAALKP
jgi:hypothetical protein